MDFSHEAAVNYVECKLPVNPMYSYHRFAF